MQNNKLYLFVTNEFERIKNQGELIKEHFEFISNQLQKNYILYNLLYKRTILIEGEQRYTLMKHHISLYEMQKDNDPNLSQYHYTAYFEDQVGEKYQLHVYFDQNDQVVSAAFAVKNKDDVYIKQNISEEFFDQLVQTSINYSFNFIAELRKQHWLLLNALKEHYEAIENELTALSADLLSNKAIYSELQTKAINYLSLLSNYHYDPIYETHLKLFEKIQDSLRSLSNLDPNISQKSETESHDEETQTDVEKLKHSKKSSKKHRLSEWIEQAYKLQNTYLSTTELPILEQLPYFLKFEQHVCDALALTIDNNYQATIEDLQKIRKLLNQSIAEGKKLLVKFLLTAQFEAAQSLKKFANPLPQNLLNLALSKGDAKLLDFLLTHAQCPINSSYVIDELTPVLYCFNKHKKESPKIACLSVLIKHNASLMVKLDGLPVAHHILAHDHHPLRAALIDNSDLTVGNIKFLRELISHLNSFMASNELNSDQKNILSTHIIAYQWSIDNLKKNTWGANNSIIKQNEEKLYNVLDKYDMSAYDKLREDPDFKIKWQTCLEAHAQFVQEMPSKQRRKLSIIDDRTTNFMDGILKSVDPSSKDFKKLVFEKLDPVITMLKIAPEMWKLRRILQTEKNKNKLKKAQHRMDELFTEVMMITGDPKFKSLDTFLATVVDMSTSNSDNSDAEKLAKSLPFLNEKDKESKTALSNMDQTRQFQRTK